MWGIGGSLGVTKKIVYKEKLNGVKKITRGGTYRYIENYMGAG